MAVNLENIDVLRLVCWPELVLTQPCGNVGWYTDSLFGKPVGDLQLLASKMLELMRREGGLGLAAPQVGLPIRMFVWSADGDEGMVVNPVLSDPTGDDVLVEGCLSMPGVQVEVRRPTGISISGMSAGGDRLPPRRAGGLLAKVWQHECDHLDGITLIQRMSAADKIVNRAALRSLKLAARRADRKKKKEG